MQRIRVLRLFFFLLLFTPMISTAQNFSGSDGETDQGQGSGQPTFGNFSFDKPSAQFDQYFYSDKIGMQLKAAKSQYALEDFINTVDYKLGPHDVLSIEVKGSVPMMARAIVVDQQGYIVLPMSGKIKVGGLSIPQAQDTVQAALQKEMTEANVNLSIEQARELTIHIHGEVPYPGKYTVPAGARLDYAIYPALFKSPQAQSSDQKGSENGEAVYESKELVKSNRSQSMDESQADRENNNVATSVFTRMYRYGTEYLNDSPFSLRNIIIKQKDGTKKRVDLLSYFKAGDKKGNPFVMPGDEIYIEKLTENDPRISISGAVNSAQEFEYSPKDSLNQLLKMAGGMREIADTTKFYLVSNSEGKMVKDTLFYDELDGGDMALNPNDRVIIPYKDSVERNQSAWVYGEVVSPGNYPIQGEETTVYELLQMASGITDQALTNGAYLIKNRSPNRGAPAVDKINPIELKRSSNQLIEGLNYLEMEAQTPDNRVYLDLENKQKLKYTHVSDGDRLIVPKDYNNVILYGQVNQPGYYKYRPEYNVEEYLDLAGGKTIAADPEQVFVIKAGSKAWHKPDETEIESGDIIYVDRVPFDELQAQRDYKIQLKNLKRTNVQLILSAVSTITAVLTTYVAITR